MEDSAQNRLTFFYTIIMLKDLQGKAEEDPLSAIYQDGFQEFSEYQKQLPQGYKSRAQKRKDRVLKLTKYLHDPEQKKLKKQEQRKVQKDKMHEIIDSMTKEEARTYLDGVKKEKADRKQRVRQAMGSGQVFMLDLVYEQKMNEKENRSLAKQIELIMRAIKHFEDPPSIHLCSFEGEVKQKMQKMDYKFWAVTPHSQNILEVGQKLGKKFVYLSPDAPKELTNVDKETAYILGGLVDRTVLKDASLKRAQQLGIEARRLPISQYMKGRLCLNLDHVVSMICCYKECSDWKQAFDFAAPKRWKKDQNQQPEEKEPKSQVCVETEVGESGPFKEELCLLKMPQPKVQGSSS